MFTIRVRHQISAADLQHLRVGYTSDAKYYVTVAQDDEQYLFTLGLAPLPAPQHKCYDPVDAAKYCLIYLEQKKHTPPGLVKQTGRRMLLLRDYVAD